MGGQNSKLQGELTKAFPEGWDDHDRVGIFGFENYGNTCYCNSVLQALYFCKPFREHVCAYRPEWLAPGEEEGAGDVTLLSTLRDLFVQMCKKSTDKKDKGPRVGTLGPKQFVIKLKQDNVMFEGLTQQDAHEFFNYVINDISEQLLRDRKRAKERRAAGELPPLPGEEDTEEDLGVGAQPPKPKPTWVQEIFGGVLTNEVRCINCECVTSRQEQILDLSLDIEQNSSLTHCLKNFSKWELMRGADKFHCDQCCSLQEAQRCMRLKVLPSVLCIQLKRFKYVEQHGRFRKLSHRVCFPTELKLPTTSDKATDPDKLYRLSAVVVHMGSGPNQGHYLAVVSLASLWLCFDDERVSAIDEDALAACYGVSHDILTNAETGYLLFYHAEDLPKDGEGLRLSV